MKFQDLKQKFFKEVFEKCLVRSIFCGPLAIDVLMAGKKVINNCEDLLYINFFIPQFKYMNFIYS